MTATHLIASAATFNAIETKCDQHQLLFLADLMSIMAELLLAKLLISDNVIGIKYVFLNLVFIIPNFQLLLIALLS